MTSCLDTAAPTPKPTLIFISLQAKAAPITTVQGGKKFQMRLRVGRTGDTIVYAGLSYEIEKLVDQKWERAYVRTFAFPNSYIFLPRPGGLDYIVSADYTEGLSPPSVLLANMRGLYRAKLTLSYTPDGSRLLPEDAGLSPPFAVVD